MDDDALRANVADTTQTAITVLTHLEDGLQRGGFAGAGTRYRQMADILLVQRGWIATNGVHDLEPSFARLGEKARQVLALIGPVHDAVRKLATLADEVPVIADAPLKAPTAGPVAEAPGARIVAALGAGELSASALRAATGFDRSALTEAMASLLASGQVSMRAASGRQLYRLERAADVGGWKPEGD